MVLSEAIKFYTGMGTGWPTDHGQFYRYGLATVRYRVLEIKGRVEPFENARVYIASNGIAKTSNSEKLKNTAVENMKPTNGL